ncbi:hypothetical protein GW935_03285 [Candidatus Falkowbacteria bacterium]|nr:hypothetical protein [Candidatus Falkowbacteria bacterium]
MFKGTMLAVLVILILSLSACTINLGGGSVSESMAGGVFRSDDFGRSWKQTATVLSPADQPISIADLDVVELRSDPTDKQGLFFGSLSNGLYYSYNYGDSWQKAERLGNRPIASLAVDFQNRCTWYAVSGPSLWRSTDCGRFWDRVYADARSDILMYSVVVDNYAPSTLYMSNAKGEILKSEDSGVNWRTVGRFERSVKSLVMSHFDSRILFAQTDNKIFRTIDGGETWTDLKDKFKSFSLLNKISTITTSNRQQGLWIMATSYGLLKTVNDGDDWTAIDLITPEKKAQINDVVISQQDVNKIYYVTDYVFYSTVDGGRTWQSLRLPTARRGWRLETDVTQDGRIYLATRRWDK